MATVIQDFPTRYWHLLEDGRIQCDLCPRACRLREGQQGLCFVRARRNNQIVLTTYGRSSGFCIDPVEKKPLNHFLPGTPILSFGTAGCQLTCQFCQNWDISKSREINILVDQALPETIARAACYYHCSSIAFTYNDPIIFMEYAIDIAKACHQKNIQTVAVTSGYICERPLREFVRHMDVVKVDLKAFTEEFYVKIAGGHLQPVLDTLSYIKHHSKAWLEIVTLLIPDENDSDQEIDAMTQWVAQNLGVDVPMHFTAFFPTWKMMDRQPTPLSTLRRARQIGMKNGLRYVYTGNITDAEGSNTYCHYCHRCVIERNRYAIVDYQLTDEGRCRFCQTRCAGVFQKTAGTWGNQCQPITLKNFKEKV